MFFFFFNVVNSTRLVFLGVPLASIGKMIMEIEKRIESNVSLRCLDLRIFSLSLHCHSKVDKECNGGLQWNDVVILQIRDITRSYYRGMEPTITLSQYIIII